MEHSAASGWRCVNKQKMSINILIFSRVFFFKFKMAPLNFGIVGTDLTMKNTEGTADIKIYV